jgi:hypothetical protein
MHGTHFPPGPIAAMPAWQDLAAGARDGHWPELPRDVDEDAGLLEELARELERRTRLYREQRGT